jgi:hypothetical protein
MFEIDAETMLPVKIYTYVFDVSAENPKWELHHELTEYYGMDDLSPSSFDKLSDTFLTDA